MVPIGKFSRMCGISVKTLRHYHDVGLLPADYVDEQTGYRYYRPGAAERARVIVMLRELDVSLVDIATILRDCQEDEDLVAFLERHRRSLDAKLRGLQRMRSSLDRVLGSIQESKLRNQDETVTEKRVEDFLFASHRRQGAWEEIGSAFGLVARRAGRHLKTPGISLCYDGEYREDASYEAGFEVKREVRGPGVECRVLPGGRCLSLLYRGSYRSISRAYEKIFQSFDSTGRNFALPTREVYWKGPGMIFRGNPDRFVTEIQVFYSD